jgi:hypothetical protein
MFSRKFRSGALIGLYIILLLIGLASPVVIPSVALAENGSGGGTPAETPSLPLEGCGIPTDSSSVQGNDGEPDQDDPSILDFIEELF